MATYQIQCWHWHTIVRAVECTNEQAARDIRASWEKYYRDDCYVETLMLDNGIVYKDSWNTTETGPDKVWVKCNRNKWRDLTGRFVDDNM